MEIGVTRLKPDPCVYTYSEGSDIIGLTLDVDDILLIGRDLTVLRRIKQKLMCRFSMTDMRDVSFVLGVGITRDREKGTVTISPENYTKSSLKRYVMASRNLVHAPGVGTRRSLHHPEERLLNKAEKHRFQAITSSVMYLSPITRYNILYAVNQLTRVMSNHPNHTWRRTWVPGRDSGFFIISKKNCFKLNAFSDPKWGNNPNNGKLMCLPSKCSCELQGGDAGAGGARRYGGRARARGASDEGGHNPFKYDEGAGIRHALQLCTTVHGHHLDPGRSWKLDLQPASQTRGSAVLFHVGARQGGNNLHQLHEDRRPTC